MRAADDIHTTAAAAAATTGDVYTRGPSAEDARNNYCLCVFFAVVGTLLFFFRFRSVFAAAA